MTQKPANPWRSRDTMSTCFIFCDCGTKGLHRVRAERVKYCPRKPRFIGDRKAAAVAVNRCNECGQNWPAIRRANLGRRRVEVNRP